MRNIEIKLCRPELTQRLTQTVDALPQYATAASAGVDLMACVEEAVTLKPGDTFFFPTGIAIHLKDPGLAAMVLSRSGLGTKQGLVVKQGVGLIDADYQGEIMVAIHNVSSETRIVAPGDRIAQLVLTPVFQARWVPVAEFSATTARGAGGFGSTGVSATVAPRTAPPREMMT